MPKRRCSPHPKWTPDALAFSKALAFSCSFSPRESLSSNTTPTWRLPPMHLEQPAETPGLAPSSGPWYKELNRYHFYVFAVAALGWLFDCMDQRIFMVSRESALTELLG